MSGYLVASGQPVNFTLFQLVIAAVVGGDKLTSCLGQSSDRTPTQLLSRINQILFLSPALLGQDRCAPSQRSKLFFVLSIIAVAGLREA